MSNIEAVLTLLVAAGVAVPVLNRWLVAPLRREKEALAAARVRNEDQLVELRQVRTAILDGADAMLRVQRSQDDRIDVVETGIALVERWQDEHERRHDEIHSMLRQVGVEHRKA